jgi:hypothetical protein
MAAPVEIEDANWHRSKQLHKECGWKRGDSAIVNLENGARSLARLPLVGDQQSLLERPTPALTSAAFSWKSPVIRQLPGWRLSRNGFLTV